MLSLSVSPHWLSQDPSQLEEELSRYFKKSLWMVSQSVDVVVGGYPLHCTQPLLLFSPEVIVFLTVVVAVPSMSPVKLVLFSDDLILSSYLHGVDM